LYQTLCDSKGIECRYYNLLPEKSWEVDLDHMRKVIDNKTRGILVNNPSNPCGSTYRKEHLLEIIQLAEQFHLPIIADEIYCNMVFDGEKYVFMAELTQTVPILSVGGIAKQYLVPGWRLGWIIMYDKQNYIQSLRQSLTNLTTLIVGPNTLVQAALPSILHETPQQYYRELNQTLQDHARYCEKRISTIPGLKVISPQGAMYVMVQIDLTKFHPESGITDDLQFCQMLMREESVVVLPGQVFRIKNFFRIVICAPIEKLSEAFDRIEQFCLRHSQKSQE